MYNSRDARESCCFANIAAIMVLDDILVNLLIYRWLHSSHWVDY